MKSTTISSSPTAVTCKDRLWNETNLVIFWIRTLRWHTRSSQGPEVGQTNVQTSHWALSSAKDRKSKLLRDIWSRNGHSQRAGGKCQNARGQEPGKPLRTAVGKKVLQPWPLQVWSSHSWQAATAADREQKTQHAQRLTRMASFSKIHSRPDKSQTLRTSNYFIN